MKWIKAAINSFTWSDWDISAQEVFDQLIAGLKSFGASKKLLDKINSLFDPEGEKELSKEKIKKLLKDDGFYLFDVHGSEWEIDQIGSPSAHSESFPGQYFYEVKKSPWTLDEAIAYMPSAYGETNLEGIMESKDYNKLEKYLNI